MAEENVRGRAADGAPPPSGEDDDQPQHAAPAHGAARRARVGRRRRRTRARRGGWLRETAIIIVGALVLSVLIKTFLVQAYYIPSGSMQDTLDVGDRVLVSKLSPGPFDVHRGDVVVFVDPGGWLNHEDEPVQSRARELVSQALTFVGLLPQHAGEHLIKRVIGVGGDTVACCDDEGRVTVNGHGIDEPYLRPGAEPSRAEFETTVPVDHLWLLGDNRSNSQDSRAHQGAPGGGAVPLGNVVGNAFVVMWPIDHVTLLRNPGAAFADVPAAP